MIINTNVHAQITANRLSINNQKSAKALEKISSGLRINRAADDVAGSAISQKMRAQIKGVQQSQRNIQDGISLVQTAEAGLSNIHEQLHRMRELAVQGANDTLVETDRLEIQKEVDQIKRGINQIANNTEFNTMKLLNGSNPQPLSNQREAGTPQIGNVLHVPPVTSAGRFNFRTNEGYPTTDLDNNQPLVFGSGSTSYPLVRINGASHQIHSLTSTSRELNGVYQNVYNVDGVEIIQSVRVVGEFQDKYEIKYEVTNHSGEDKNIGIMFHMDTMLGNDDRAPFIVNGQEISNATVYTGSNMPTDFIVYNQNTGTGGNAEFQAHGILRTTGEFIILEEPSQFSIGHYSSVSAWNYSPSGSVGDSGFSIQWNERTVAAGQSFAVNTFYGQSLPPDVRPPSNDQTGPFDIVLQAGPNSGQTFRVQLSDVRTTKLGIETVGVSSRTQAEEAITQLDVAIQKVSEERGKFGAYQNRLEHTHNNMANYEINLSAAESRIADADIAKEILEMTKTQILSQASQSMLAQANQRPQQVLQLLS